MCTMTYVYHDRIANLDEREQRRGTDAARRIASRSFPSLVNGLCVHMLLIHMDTIYIYIYIYILEREKEKEREDKKRTRYKYYM
jgi:hypothetical protein